MGAGMTSSECSGHDTVNISQEKVSDMLYTSSDTIIITIVIPIILCLGVINNSAFFFVMLRVPKLRSDTNVYLASLALADLLFLNLASTLNIWRYTASVVVSHDPFVNSAQCVSFFIVIETAYFASIALVTTVSFERYLALCHPIKHLKIRGRRRTYRIIALCWLVGFLVAIATVMLAAKLTVKCLNWPEGNKYTRNYPSSVANCDPVSPQAANYTEQVLNVPWLISVLANFCMYVRIFQTLNRRSVRGGIASNDPNAIQIRNQVAKMLIVNGMVFFLCQTPYRIISLARWICNLADIPNPLEVRSENWIYLIPQYINASSNPLIYAAMTAKYRAALREAFCCGRQQQRQTASPLAQDQKNTAAVALASDEKTGTCETRL